MNFKQYLFKNKLPSLFYYILAIIRECSWNWYLRQKQEKIQATVQQYCPEEIRRRLNYYNRMPTAILNAEAIRIKDYKIPKKTRVYYFDSKEYLRYYNTELKFCLLPGDIITVPQQPTIVKSRPIAGDNNNSVVLNLDKFRHFNFIHDPYSFRDKKDMLIGRGGIWQPHRIRFYEMYFNHPLCDLGAIIGLNTEKWKKPKISINAHLQYKFILALEGNDVATNLKWIMSSNSIAVMPKPKYETWFMEGTLLPDYHYIHIKDDYSDLEERLHYYIQNTDKAEAIIRNAHEYINQFGDKKKEKILSLLVLEKYFDRTGQIKSTYQSFFSTRSPRIDTSTIG